jgi:Tfp pilus assembly protein PilV
MTGRHSRCGYILLEAVAAMAVLSIGLLAVNQGMREALRTRGQARDYTQARFVLEDVMGRLLFEPLLAEGTKSGTAGEGELSRFRWSYTVSRVEIPAASMPGRPRLASRAAAVFREPPAEFMLKVEASVSLGAAGA